MYDNKLINFLNKFENYNEWLKDLYHYEKNRLIKIFPESTHEELFDNFKLNESDLESHLNFSISGNLLGIYPNNPNKECIMRKMDTHIVYSNKGKNYTFQDIINIFDNEINK